ncbi:UDP-glucose 4-epimerase GalE, partial [Candidatus Saccharibacteria bacterium]|nr:UDP-glucose 4-epimerase GalE [Candidatus Saccharibacteria bacterium]
MKNILVTGGLGFIGSHTTVELSNAGYTPIIIDNLSNSNINVLDGISKIIGTKPKFYQGNYQDEKLLDRVLTDNKIDGVIHFAAYKAVGESIDKPLDYYQNNVAGLITLLSSLLDNNVEHFVFSSSCTVYGEPDRVPITEEAPIKPATSPYGATKQIDEIILKDTTLASSLKVIALRYFNPIGAHNSALIGELPKGTPANLVPYITQAAAGLRDKLTVNGNDYPTPDGTCIRDYIHVVDLAHAHLKALEFATKQKQSYYDVFNLGTGNGSSVLEVINNFQHVTGVNVP